MPRMSRWGKSHALLLEGGLNYESIVSSVANAKIGFRDGISQLFEALDVSKCLVFF